VEVKLKDVPTGIGIPREVLAQFGLTTHGYFLYWNIRGQTVVGGAATVIWTEFHRLRIIPLSFISIYLPTLVSPIIRERAAEASCEGPNV
jgi:hypothetical protein